MGLDEKEALRVAQHEPQAGAGRLGAEPYIAEPGLGKDAERELDGGLHDDEAGDVGQEVPMRDRWRLLESPASRPAAATSSRGFRLSAPPRATRAKTGMLKMPMATMALTAPGPTSVVISTATMIAGKAKTKITGPEGEPFEPAPDDGGGEPQRHADGEPMHHRERGDGEAGERAATSAWRRGRGPSWSVPSQ
jgi:hypothetical protein